MTKPASTSNASTLATMPAASKPNASLSTTALSARVRPDTWVIRSQPADSNATEAATQGEEDQSLDFPDLKDTSSKSTTTKKLTLG